MLKTATALTEIAMLIYWALAIALTLELVSIDPALMYSDYENPLVIAWNWSFFPIDIAFAFIGLRARFGRVSGALKFKLEIIAAVLMLCAGLMAISFLIVTADFEPMWWGMNIWLFLLGTLNLVRAKPN